MKCPKCHYLGFETGDRCRNCGYDFSLLADDAVSSRIPDLPLREVVPASSGLAAWDDGLRITTPPAGAVASRDRAALTPLDAVTFASPSIDTSSIDTSSIEAVPPDPSVTHPAMGASLAPATAVETARRAVRGANSSLPLFHAGADDEPLVTLPAAPRPPLAVRRTPDKARLRTVPKPPRRPAAAAAMEEPALTFAEDPIPSAARTVTAADTARRPAQVVADSSGSWRRLTAAAIDHGILLSIDATVVYFTLKMAALGLNDWHLLPPIPLAAFLGMVKVAYFGAFTLLGGQTIGKMAAQIRVVSEDGGALDPARVIQRTAVGAVSLLAAGIGFIPMLVAADRRGLHDRVARTRVVRS